MAYRLSIVALLFYIAHPVTAADIAREIHSPSGDSAAFAELGVVFGASKVPLVGFNDQSLVDSGTTESFLGIGLMGRFEYRNFFIEFIENSFSNATLGVAVRTTPDTEIELIFSSLFEKTVRNKFKGMETIDDRDADLNAGLRGTHYFGDEILQFELVRDVIDSHNGFLASLQFGRQVQIRNWNIHALLGIRYFSDNVVDHLFGVSAVEATEDIPQYNGGHGFMPTLQLGAGLPLNERWILRGRAEYAKLPDSVSDSPLAQGEDIYFVQTGIYYVFGGG